MDRIAFFCFSIYRYLCDDRHSNLDTSPYKNIFYEFAESHKEDKKFLEKMNSYSGEQLRYFGTLRVKTENGSFTTSGGDTRNYAYKTAKTFLTEHFDAPKSNSKTIDGAIDDAALDKGSSQGTASSKSPKKLPLFWLMILLIFAVIWPPVSTVLAIEMGWGLVSDYVKSLFSGAENDED